MRTLQGVKLQIEVYMAFALHEKGGFKYIDEGNGETMLLLHGLFGALSNWDSVVDEFSKKYNESLLQLEHPHSDNMEHYMIYKEKTQL